MLIEFIIQHLIISSVLVVAVILLIYQQIDDAYVRHYGICAQELSFRINKGALLIDIRSQHAFAVGHISKAISIERTNLAKTLTKSQLKDSEIILYDDDGREARHAYRLLKKIGGRNVTYLIGGIEAWHEDGFTLKGKGSSHAK